jgi:hypothetical protein
VGSNPTRGTYGITLSHAVAQRDLPSNAPGHLSLRLSAALHERLTTAARTTTGENRSRLAARLIDEGLRMDAHPDIVFRPGPRGRRPGLAGGPDVWEVARVLRDSTAGGGAAIDRAAEPTGLAVHQVRIAARYYPEFTDEVDAWIAEVDREAEEGYPHRAAR